MEMKFLPVVVLMAALALGGCKKKTQIAVVEDSPQPQAQAEQAPEPAQPSRPLVIYKVICKGHEYEMDENHIKLNDFGADGKTTSGKQVYVRGTFTIEEK